MRSHRHTDSSFPSGNATSSSVSGWSSANKPDDGGLGSLVVRVLFIMLIAVFAAASLEAQDLGSSNKIFSDKKAKPEPAKKFAPAPKARKARPTATRQPRAAKPAAKPVARTPVRIAPRPAVKAVKAPPFVDGALMAEYASLLARGNEERRRRNLPEAESIFKRAATLVPGRPDAYRSLGELYSDSMRWEAAERSFRNALDLAAGDPETNIGLSRALSQPVVSADLYARYDEAERLARTAMRLSGTAAAYDQLGVTLELRGLLGVETESAYRQAIAADRKFALAYAHLGRLLRRKGKAADAAAAYAAASESAVDAAQMTAVAESFQSEQRYKESVPLLSTALRLQPRNYETLVLLGRALSVTGDYPAAETHLIMATRLSPFSFAAFGELGRLYIRQRKADMALSTLDHAAQLAYRFERLELARDLESLGDLFEAQDHRKGAATAYSRSLTLDPARASTTEKLARVRR